MFLRPTMSLTMRCPDAKAIEFGGVETGSMKAYEHPTVAGIMKYRGFIDTRIACRDKDKTKSSTLSGWKVNSFPVLDSCMPQFSTTGANIFHRNTHVNPLNILFN